MKILSFLVFCDFVVLRGHILNISKTVFAKLILHQQLRNQLPDAFLQKFHIHSMYAINQCI